MGRVYVRSAAAFGGTSAVSVPAAVLPALLCAGDEGSHCHHGCGVQKGNVRSDNVDIF